MTRRRRRIGRRDLRPPSGPTATSRRGPEAEAAAEGESDDREDEEPVLAEAGLLVSEPEMPTDSSEDEERPG